MQKRKHRILSMVLIVAMTAGMVAGLGGCGKKNGDELTITNVSYDPTREFYEKYNITKRISEKKYGSYSRTEVPEVRQDPSWKDVMPMSLRWHLSMTLH